MPLEVDIEDQDQDLVGFNRIDNNHRHGRNRNKQHESGLKALRNHLFVVILRILLTLLSLSVLAYVAWLSKQWVEEKRAADDDDSYVLGFVGVSFHLPLSLSVIPYAALSWKRLLARMEVVQINR